MRRFAKVEGYIFSYKKDRRDHGGRHHIDIKNAKIRYSNSNGGSTGEGFENFIQITSGSEVIVLAFENVLKFEQWKRCLS